MIKKIIANVIILAILLTLTACTEKDKKLSQETPKAINYTVGETSCETEKENSDVTAAVADESKANISTNSNEIQSTAEKKNTENKTKTKKEPAKSESSSSSQTVTSVSKQNSSKESKTETASEIEPAPIKTMLSEAEVEQKVAEYINRYRLAQGDSNATVLSGLTEVARYRAVEIQRDFSHNSVSDACTALKYGVYIDMTKFGGREQDSYYRGYSKEAIGKGDLFGMAAQLAERIATGFKNSAGHWSYVGSSEYKYIAVGIKFNEQQSKWYCCICMSTEDYGG